MEIEVTGESMKPSLVKGQKVRVRESVPALGLVAAFQSGEIIIIHRIVDQFTVKGKRYFVHQGDASPTPGIFAEHEFIGIVEDCPARRIGWWGRWLTRFRLLRSLRKQHRQR